MSKNHLKLTAILLLLLACVSSCGPSSDGSSGKRKERFNRPKLEDISLPKSKDLEVVAIIPAGALAMRVPLAMAESMERQLGKRFGSLVSMAGGVSSGSLTAAALVLDDPPRYSAADLKGQLKGLGREVFPTVNELMDMLVKDYDLSLVDMQAVFLSLVKNPPDLSTAATTEDSMIDVFTDVAAERPSMLSKINKKGGISQLKADIAALNLFDKLSATDHAANLEKITKRLLGDPNISDPSVSKLIAISTDRVAKKPVYFANAAVAPFLSGPYAEGDTPLSKALVASAAIPGFFKAARDINFVVAPGSVKNISELVDGYVGLNDNFDPSAVLYEIFTKQFANHDLVIIYLGNGAPVDRAWRKAHKIGRNRVSQTTNAKGKTVTYVALDAYILDDRENIFDVASFYASNRTFDLMDKAAQKATETPTFRWLIDNLRKVQK